MSIIVATFQINRLKHLKSIEKKNLLENDQYHACMCMYINILQRNDSVAQKGTCRLARVRETNKYKFLLTFLFFVSLLLLLLLVSFVGSSSCHEHNTHLVDYFFVLFWGANNARKS